MSVTLIDNSPNVKASMENAKKMILSSIGETAEKYAKANCPVDTGRLRNSITHAIFEEAVYIGTNVDYAIYVEVTDSMHHNTGGAHFLRNSVANHSDEYKKLANNILLTF